MEEGSQPVVSSDELVLFVKQWNPSTMTLGPFQEIALESKCFLLWFFFEIWIKFFLLFFQKTLK